MFIKIFSAFSNSNFFNSFKILSNDFMGISINLNGILHFVLTVVISLSLLFLCYLVGRKFITFFLGPKDTSWESHFFSFGLGYIFIGTGVFFLGVFSLFYIQVFVLYFFVLTIFGLFKTDLVRILLGIKNIVINAFSNLSFEKIIFIALLVSIFLRLLPPETGSDPLYYHTGYPKAYVKNHTMMISPIGDLGYITIPQLSEMYYVVVTIFGVVEATKYIHFFFLTFTAIFLWYIGKNSKDKKIFKYASLFLISSPLVIHIGPSAYGDMQGAYLFLACAVALCFKKVITYKHIALSGIFFGGLLATKTWGLYLYPFIIGYLAIIFWDKKKTLFTSSFLFVLSSIPISLFWYLRSFVMTGNLLYFKDTDQSQGNVMEMIARQLILSPGFLNSLVLLFYNFLPLFFFGLLSLLFFPKLRKQYLRKYPILLFGISAFLYTIIFSFNANPRYFLPVFAVTMLASSVGLFLLTKNKLMHYAVNLFFIIFSVYFLINSLILLPYGLGWASQDKYLERRFTIDPGVYYDFQHQFSKNINKDETIATYGMSGFYYANFNYVNAYAFIDSKKNNFFSKLKSNRINKILLRNGDISWFCQNLKIENECAKHKFVLLSEYSPAHQYLYQVNY